MYKKINAVFMAATLFIVFFMVTDWFKELDRIHRMYIAIALMCSGVPAFMMAYIDGFRTARMDRTNEVIAEIMAREAEVTDKDTKTFRTDMVEYQAAHSALDREGVPRDVDGQLLSLWGRIDKYVAKQMNAEVNEKASAHG